MRIGVLGGTFNPIHNAHLQMAQCAKDTLNLDKVLMMVASDPPHKKVDGHIGADVRFFMTQLACRNVPGVEASNLELRRKGKSHTLDTLLELKKQEPEAGLVLIIGSDMLQGFVDWHQPKDVAKLCEIACVPRKGLSSADKVAAATLRRDYGAKLTMLPACADVISSTEIRRCVEEALPVSDFVPKNVEWYLYENGLYFPPALKETQTALKKSLSPVRYQHVVGTMIEAVRLAALWGADPKQARIAALLHDCAKELDKRALAVYSGDDSGILPVLHAFAGAVLARTEYGVTDEDVLRAIRLHSTGDYAMTTLDKIIYLADITEPTRSFEGVDGYRKALKKGADEAMIYALTQTEKRLLAAGAKFHPASARALAYYQNLKEVSR